MARSLHRRTTGTAEVIQLVDPAKLRTEFQPIVDACSAMARDLIDHANKSNESILAASDEFYEKFVAAHCDMSKPPMERVNKAARDFIARETNAKWEVAAQDRTGLSPAVRYFLGFHKRDKDSKGEPNDRQNVNRLATMGAAASFYTKTPSALVADEKIGKGNIDTALRVYREARDDRDPEAKKLKAERTAKREAAATDKALADPKTIERLLASDDAAMQVADNLMSRFGQQVDGVGLEFVVLARGSVSDRKLERDRMFNALGAPDDGEEFMVKLVRNGDRFDVLWTEIGAPEAEGDETGEDKA